jgi:hypothetical protein
MYYSEYLNAARKHLLSCRVINKEIQEIITKPSGQIDESKLRLLTLNLYYLSGYIIECSVKYGIYGVLEYDRTKCIKNLNYPYASYDTHIKHHKFKRYVDIFNAKKSGLILIDDTTSIGKEVKHLYSMWDAEIRYFAKVIPPHYKNANNYTFVKSFYECSEIIFTTIRDQIR